MSSRVQLGTNTTPSDRIHTMVLTRYIRENPIVARLIGLILLCSIAITLIAIGLQLYSSYQDDVAALEKRLDQARISTVASITKSLWGFDHEQLTIQVESLLDVADVVQVQVNWLDWNNAQQRIISRHAYIQSSGIEKNANDYLIRSYPLIYEDPNTPPQQLGTLIMTASLAGINHRLWQRGLFIGLLEATKMLLISAMIWWIVHGVLTRHLKSVAQYARQLHLPTLNHPLSLNRKANQHTPDELDNVVDAINHMRETLLADIQQRHQVEDALRSEQLEKLETRRQKNAAEDASRAKSQFLATMSHEIRTPMNGVIGMLDLLRDTPLNDTQKHYLDIIHRSGETLLAIINDILDYSKIEAGKMRLENTPFDLEELIEDSLQLFSASASRRGLELFGGLKPGTPKYLIGDPTRLRQIIINLLGNAFKFTEQGHISLQVEAVSSADQGAQLKFSVQDTGIGIDIDIAGELFDSFSQADTSTTRKYGGTGLGLAICKQLAELMGGDIGVESTIGEGSRFWFTAHFAINHNAQLNTEFLTQQLRSLHKKNLMIASPNLQATQFLAQYGHSWGMDIVIAPDACGTLSYLDEGHPCDALVISDQLPDSSGEELILTLRALPELAELPIFLIINQDATVDYQQTKALNISAFLRRPLTAKRLQQALLHKFRPHKLPEQVSTPRPTAEQLAGLRVLVAEDNAVNRMVISGLLGKLGIVPTLVENGRQARNAMIDHHDVYSVLLMDCEMPEMDGFEATRQIRDFEHIHQLEPTRIIALTAHALPEHREAVLAVGMDDYLSKPISLERLKMALERAILK